MKNLVIIDTTSLIWTACTTLREDVDNYKLCRSNFNCWFENILEDTEAGYYIAFTDKGNFRKDILVGHKADREADRPKFIKPLMEDAIEEWGIQAHSKLESDDLCLINHNHYKDKFNITIASPDSDLRQYPATFFNYKKKRKESNPEWQTINEEEAKLNLWTTILMGGHNGLKGLSGCGEQTAKQYLVYFKPEQFPFAVLSAYIKGIDKAKYPGTRNIKGYGEYKGLIEFNNNYLSEKLLTTIEEVEQVLPNNKEQVIYEPIKIESGITEW